MKPIASNSTVTMKTDLIEDVDYQVNLWASKYEDNGPVPLDDKEQIAFFNLMKACINNNITLSMQIRERVGSDPKAFPTKGYIKLFPNDGE